MNPDVEQEYLSEVSTPSGYAYLALGIDLYPWQVAVLDALDRPHTRAALRTCNESGKTSTVIAALVMWHMETFAESVTVTTSGAYRQIVDQLYPNLRAYAQKRRAENWNITKDRGVYLPTKSRLISFSTDNPGLAEGWHEPPRTTPLFADGANPLAAYGINDEDWQAVRSEKTSLLIVIDEAKSVDEGIFAAFERCHPTRYLVASSPGEAAGPFYDTFHAQARRYAGFHASAQDCPHLWADPVRRRELEEQIETLPVPLVASMIYGEFSQSGEYMVFDMALVAIAQSGTVPRWGAGVRRAALDLSGGGDETCLYIRDGNEAWLAGVWHERDDRKLVGMVIAELQRYQVRPEWCAADNGGLGAVILNEFDRRGWPLSRIDFGGKPRNERFYADRRAEMFLELSNRVKRREIRLPQDTILRDQLSWQKYKPGYGPLRLIPKDKMPRSPDRADTVAMLFDDMPAAAEHYDRQDQQDQARNPCPIPEWRQHESDAGTGLW